jgi:G3E family GTPase
MPFFRQVLIETTGLADPLPILHAVLQHPYLSKRFTIAGLITLVDAVHGAQTLVAHPEARRQVALADEILITKADLATPETMDALKAAISDVNLTAPIIADEADFDASALFAPRFAPRTEAAITKWLGDAETARHSTDIETFAFTSNEPIPEASLIVFQEAMRVLHGPRLLRLKGLIALREDPERPVVIHHVQSIAHQPVRLDRWPGRDRRTRLVFITQGIARETITRFWDALVAAAK